MLGTSEEEVALENAKNLGSLGIAGRRRSFIVHHSNDPQARQANVLAGLLTKAEMELCMTPAARARIGRFADASDRTLKIGDRFYKCG